MTRDGPGVEEGEPERYFASGPRSLLRLTPPDDTMGAAGALFAQRQGARSVFVLDDKDPYGFAVAEAFALAAERLGLELAGRAQWDAEASDYRALARRVRGSGADTVYLGGYVFSNGPLLIKDLREALGPDAEILGPDGPDRGRRPGLRDGDHAAGRAAGARMRTLGLILAGLVALTLPACAGDDAGERQDVAPATPVEASGCSPIRYGGTGRPDVLIAASTVLQGRFVEHGVQISQALELVLADHDWRAGEYRVGLQVCDETTAATGDHSDPRKCRRNAHAFSSNRSVIAVAGPWSSTCALEVLPILNRAPGGPLGAISGSTTYLGLTRPGPGVGRREPARYSPTGRRGFVRVVPADDVQGAAGAIFAERRGASRVFVLNDDEPYGFGIAEAFRLAAKRTGLSVAGAEAWDPNARGYRALADRVRAAGADAVFLGGYVSMNGVRLIEDLRAALGSEALIIGPDGFATPGPIVEGAGAAAEGFTWTIPTLPNDELPAPGREFAAEFEERYSSRPCCFSVHAAQTASMILDAIEDADGSRSRVTEILLDARVNGGYLGDFEIDRYGDTTLTEIGVYRIEDGRLRFQSAIAPAGDLLARR